MRETANYNFPVPERSDYAKIETIAQTFEKIDVEIKRIDVKVDESEQEVDYVKHPGYGVTTFSSPTYSVTLSPAPTQYIDGMGLVLRLNADQVAGNAAINVNGLGVKSILNTKGFSVTNLKKDAIYSFRYSAAKGAFILQGESEVEIGQQIIKPSTTRQTILKGLHDGTGYVEGDSNLTASNILAGKTIFGITGNVQPKQFRIFYITGNDAFEKIDWGFPFKVLTVVNGLGNITVYLSEIKDGYLGGGNYTPGMGKFTTDGASVEFYYYKNGGTYTIKVYG